MLCVCGLEPLSLPAVCPPSHLVVAIERGGHERSPPIAVDGIGIGAGVEQRHHHLDDKHTHKRRQKSTQRVRWEGVSGVWKWGLVFSGCRNLDVFWGENGKVYSSTTTAPISIKICAGETAFDGQQQGRVYDAGFLLIQ